MHHISCLTVSLLQVGPGLLMRHITTTPLSMRRPACTVPTHLPLSSLR